MTERLVDTIVSTLRAEYPGIAEEWERQRTDSPEWDFPAFDTPSGLGWWLDSERFITQEFAAGSGKDDETERRLGAFCVQALERLQTAPAEEEPTAPNDEREERLRAISTRIVNELADRRPVPLDHSHVLNGADEAVIQLLKGGEDE